MPRPITDIKERFWSKVDKSGGESACWPWLAHCSWNRYGEFRLSGKNGKLVKAHRFAYESFFGIVSESLDLDHLCRNRKCCNPKHLEPVSRKINAIRGLCGVHKSKLTSNDCKEIKALRNIVKGVELAKRYGVSKACISRVQLHYSDETISLLGRFQQLE